MKKIICAMFGAFALTSSVMANPACPVCTIAIGAALPITRRLGISDASIGVWAGAFLAIMGYWIITFMTRRNWNFPGRNAIVLILSVATIGFAYIGQVRYTPCTYMGFLNIDPLLFGTILGAALFIVTEKVYEWMRDRRGGHAHFPFEKVVLPIVILGIASIILNICR